MAASVGGWYRRHGDGVGSDTRAAAPVDGCRWGTTSACSSTTTTTTPGAATRVARDGFHLDRLQHDVITDLQDTDTVVVAGGGRNLQQLASGTGHANRARAARNGRYRSATARYRPASGHRCRIQCTERTRTQPDDGRRWRGNGGGRGGRCLRLLLLLDADDRADGQCRGAGSRRYRLPCQYGVASTGQPDDLWRLLKDHVRSAPTTAPTAAPAGAAAAATR